MKPNIKVLFKLTFCCWFEKVDWSCLLGFVYEFVLENILMLEIIMCFAFKPKYIWPKQSVAWVACGSAANEKFARRKLKIFAWGYWEFAKLANELGILVCFVKIVSKLDKLTKNFNWIFYYVQKGFIAQSLWKLNERN